MTSKYVRGWELSSNSFFMWSMENYWTEQWVNREIKRVCEVSCLLKTRMLFASLPALGRWLCLSSISALEDMKYVRLSAENLASLLNHIL